MVGPTRIELANARDPLNTSAAPLRDLKRAAARRRSKAKAGCPRRDLQRGNGVLFGRVRIELAPLVAQQLGVVFADAVVVIQVGHAFSKGSLPGCQIRASLIRMAQADNE